MPWWAKIAAKMVLSRLPAGYATWRRLGAFRHGAMNQAGYACSVFDAHVAAGGLTGQLAGKQILELGPGDSVATAVIAAAQGARAVLVDVGRFAEADPRNYFTLAEHLRTLGLNPPDLSSCRSIEEVLRACDAQYLTDGVRSFRQVQTASIDLLFSQAVLEHVRRHEFLEMQRECARVLRADGVCSHRVDLRDHLDGTLNNLRFPHRVWESAFFVRSGFYTNRMQFDEICTAFEDAAFLVTVRDVRRWDSLPLERRKLAAEFCGKSDEILRISGFDVLLKKRAARASE